ncbi:MAG: DinB family protein [Bacteroidota bacterium]
MQYLFRYNWKVRDEWFEVLKPVPSEELYKSRVGGVGSIAYTMFHVSKVEYDWISDLQQKPIFNGKFEDYSNFEDIIELSKELRKGVFDYVEKWSTELEHKVLDLEIGNENRIHCTYGEAIRHVIVHEIHHIGQLSVWAREIGVSPISANFIHRGLLKQKN